MRSSRFPSWMEAVEHGHRGFKPWRPQRDPPLCPCSTVPIHDGNLEDLNEILCVRVQPLPSMTETLKTSTRSSSVSVFNRFHPRRKPWRPRPTTNCTLPPSNLTTECHRPVTPTQIQRAHSFRTPTDVRAKQWRFQIVSLKIQANNRWRRRRKKKIGSLPKRTTTTVVCVSTNNCLADLVVKHEN